jgi:hypothetical protein
MERPVVENKIAEALKSYPKGSVLFVDDFIDYGNSESVKKALLRLKEKEHRTHNSVYVANRRSVLLRNLVLNGKVSASNPLLHIHANRYQQAQYTPEKLLNGSIKMK